MATNLSSRTPGSPDIARQLRKASALANEMLADAVAGGRRTMRQATDMLRVMQPEMPAAAPAAGTRLGVPCCPPGQWCPPACILEITRRAHAGEIVLVPFKVRNTAGVARRYLVGLRPLLDEHGNPAPAQPSLDKLTADVEPNQSVLFEMRLDLTHPGFAAGRSYETMIVVREQKYNQNICFRLELEPFSDVPVAEPFDEKLYDCHFVSWHHHFYCCDEPEADPAKTHPREMKGQDIVEKIKEKTREG